MGTIGRGPGRGHKRRIRLCMQSEDITTVNARRNRSKKFLPSNWRELLVDAVNTTCLTGEKVKGLQDRVRIPRPTSVIAPGSRPTGIVTFVLSEDDLIRGKQRRAIDHALETCDVHIWPVPMNIKIRTNRDGDVFLNTGMSLKGLASNCLRFHSFKPEKLKGVSGIHWDHLEQYAAGARNDRLGIKTSCGSACGCQVNLEKLWPLGWEMHY